MLRVAPAFPALDSEGRDTSGSRPAPWRIRSLDGLRALSIVIVLLGHWRYSDGYPFSEVQAWLPLEPRLGVCLFFIISGFLITTLLLREKDKFGSISLKLFYLRRSIRIFPPFYCYMAVVAVLWGLGVVQIAPGSFASGALYYRNFHPGDEMILGHVWSLSIEEQFYLLWPLFVLVLNPRACMLAALALIALRPAVRLFRHGYLLPPDGVAAFVDAGMEVILYGALLALIMHVPRGARLAIKTCQGTWGLFIPWIVLWICTLVAAWVPGPLTWLLQQTRDLMLTWFLLWCIWNADSGFGRFLNWKPVAWVGVVSYSLYLWHPIFLMSFHGWAFAFPQNMVFVFLAASLSYYLVEQPLNGLRSKFSR